MRLDNHGYSLSALRLIVQLAARLNSYDDAAFALTAMGLSISTQHVCTLTQQIGTELVGQRDQQARRGRSKATVRVAATPEVVVIEVDGGRLRTRATDAGPGVHDAQNKEDKIAALVTMKSVVCAQDPQPEPPLCFQLPRRVAHVVHQMAGQAGDASTKDVTEAEPLEKQAQQTVASGEPEEQPWAPRKQIRTCVASMANSQAFGRMVAVEAKQRDFYRAKRKAFVADGAAYNWKIQQRHFATFVPIVDFLHVLCYVYRAAWAVGADEAKRWQQYLEWLRACWQGRVAEVIEQLRAWQRRLGEAREGEELAATDPRRVVAETLSYFGHNEERMKYPEYRRQGLPITSSLVESLVGQFNARVKSKQKYWNRGEGAEAILHLRAALLSEDGRLDRYFAERRGSPYRRRVKQGT